MKRTIRHLSRDRSEGSPETLFADDVFSAVTPAECDRLAELAAGGRVLEIGSFLGRSTIAMAAVARVVHSIDPHNGGPPEQRDTLSGFLSNLARYGVRDRVVVHVGVSSQIVPLFRESTFDLVFIDAAHHRPHVDRDLRLALDCLTAGGVIACHDYATEGAFGAAGDWEPFSVDVAVDEFAVHAGVAVERVDSLAVIFVPAPTATTDEHERWATAIAALDEFLAR